MMPLLQGKSLTVVPRLIRSSITYLLLTVEGMVRLLLIWQSAAFGFTAASPCQHWSSFFFSFF